MFVELLESQKSSLFYFSGNEKVKGSKIAIFNERDRYECPPFLEQNMLAVRLSKICVIMMGLSIFVFVGVPQIPESYWNMKHF